jgi:hypothetical protein
MSEDVEGWTENRRRDGLAVRPYSDGFFAVCNARDDILIAECLWCGTSLRTTRAAKLVANALYPLKEPPQ